MRKRSHFKAMRKLIILVKPLSSSMVAAIILGLIGHFCASFITIFGIYGLLNLLGYSNVFTPSLLLILLFALALGRAMGRYGEQTFNHYIAFSILAIVRDKVFKALRRLSPAKLEGMDKGNLISIITSDVELLEVFYAHTISPIVIALFFSLGLSFFIGQFHWLLGILALMIYILIGVFLPLFTTKLSKDFGNQFREKSGLLSSFMLETLQGLSEVIQYQQKENRMTQLTNQTQDLLSTEQQMKKLTGFNIALTNLIIMLCNLSMIIVASILYVQNTITFVGFVISITALMSSYGPVIALSNLASTLQNTFAAAHRILDILEEEPVVQPISNQPSTEFGPIEVQQVSFKYDQTPVLTDVSLQVQPESILGIRGKSGSGKSTLLKLLMRFWETNQGDISINQRLLNSINTTDLRDMQAYMTQETHLFNDTIANNIKIAKLDASMEDIIEASKKASLHEFVLSLPLGYETKTGELGNALSGGERQRIGLARAFLHDSDLMLLDEPTSNLDSLNEAIILKSLADKRENKTIVLVSHRPSTMAITDTMIHIKEGQIQS